MNTIIPKYTKGKRRKTNPEYNALMKYRYSREGVLEGEASRDALKKMRTIPRMDLNDPEFRRSMYIRYADDFVFLLEGQKKEALAIRDLIKVFLKENIGLELNMTKTLVTNLKEGFNFLGASIKKLRNVDFRMKTTTVKGNQITMRVHTRLRINMPTKLLIDKLITNGLARRNHLNHILAKPYTSLVNLDHATIIQFYNSKVHGLLNYYSFAGNRIEIQNLI
jgi:Type II intron maturase